MLHIDLPRGLSACDGVSRREFLRIGSLGLTGVTLPGLWRARAAVGESAKADRSVVWLWLGGGASHIETFDPKMSAPSEYRSVVGAVRTRIPGIQLGGVFPLLAERMDRLAIVRSFTHRNSGHGGGTHWVMTGYDFPAADNGAAPNKPGIGAIVAKHRGPNHPRSGLPTYVRMNSILGDGAAWLGPSFAPFDAGGRAKQNLELRMGLKRLDDRRALLSQLDRANREVDRSGVMSGLDELGVRAFDLVLGRAKEAFDLNREPLRLRENYGKGLGEQLLLARRLCEWGVGFVTIHFGGWDMHGDIARGMNSLGPRVDRAVSAFLDDVRDRGLSDRILLVITGEFGRTPRVNGSSGRDHWASLSTLALAGGGLQMGQVVGESSARAEIPKSSPVTPQDLMATVFRVLGLPLDLQLRDPVGRNVPAIADGRPIPELI
ncbi:MAG: DUF1501 domain-containing protein [Gemmataceae bacterium]|nr:DUF1501 domain-containing protein [Gemmataceae bacterium]